MQHFPRGLFDRLDSSQEPVQHSIVRDLENLLNTRCAWTTDELDAYPQVGASVLNYGLMDFAGLSLSSDGDQQRVCRAVQLAIERHEPRLHRVTVTLAVERGAINRIDFLIRAELRGTATGTPLRFNAVFRPSQLRYAVEPARHC